MSEGTDIDQTTLTKDQLPAIYDACVATAKTAPYQEVRDFCTNLVYK